MGWHGPRSTASRTSKYAHQAMSRPSCVNGCGRPGRQEARDVTGGRREITAPYDDDIKPPQEISDARGNSALNNDPRTISLRGRYLDPKTSTEAATSNHGSSNHGSSIAAVASQTPHRSHELSYARSMLHCLAVLNRHKEALLPMLGHHPRPPHNVILARQPDPLWRRRALQP